ncbi:MAG: hypothetical protein L0H83_03020, partial [Salinisphaera sp.]|nr:hypothetical protein [Salinisphaera sp.]
ELDLEKAAAALSEHVAEPLGISVEAAAVAVRNRAAEDLAQLVGDTLVEAELGADDVSLFLFGGNGPTVGAFVAEAVGVDAVYAFDLGPVFSAFGAAISDVVHVYERGVGKKFSGDNRQRIVAEAQDLYQQAARDLRGEGFDPEQAQYSVEMEFGEHEELAGSVRFDSDAAPGDKWFVAAEKAVTDTEIDTARWPLLLLRLSVRYSLGTHALQKSDRRAANGRVDGRAMVFAGDDEAERPVHRWEDMGPASEAEGPSVINGATLTCVLPPGWRLRVDDYGNAVMRREEQ